MSPLDTKIIKALLQDFLEMACFVTAKADLWRFRSHFKQFVGLVSAHEHGLENFEKLRNDMPFNDLSAYVIDKSFHGNLQMF